MNIKSLLVCLVFLSMASNSLAWKIIPAHGKKNRHTGRVTLADPGEENYDVKHLRFNLHLNDTSLHISGDVTTTAQVIAFSMSSYIFELDTLMTIDSAKINGVLRPVVSTGNYTRTIILPTALPGGSIFTAQIYYHGMPPTGSGFFNGVTQSVSSWGTPMIYSVSDPWEAQAWWPAKQSATDKIDSVDMFITVPAGQVDGSNGVLVNIDTTTTPGFWTYHWQTHYAIDYYLISIAVSKFVIDKSYLHFTGSTDSMLVENFFTDTASFYPLYKTNFDSIPLIIDYYSSLFGRYPFWKEKYGVCYTTLPGGMEHQTLTTIGVPNTYIIAHELMHQWFGDHVTYATWGEMWLSEGFACFSEQLFLTHFWGPAAGRAHRHTYLNSALTQPCGQEYVTDTSGPNTLFYQPTVYYKGQGIVTMLRILAPTDSQFFQVLRNYQQNYAFGNGSVAEMNAIADSVYGFSLDSFFNEWIYGYGFPKYTITWNQVGTTVYVQLIQTPSCTGHPTHFNTPVELQLHSAAGDTIVIAYNTLDTQVFTYTWADTMSSLILNPDTVTICKLLTLTQDKTLGIFSGNPISRPAPRIYPNPSGNYWQIDLIEENTVLVLTDITGKVVWRGKAGKGITLIPGKPLPAGDYLLKAGNMDSVKLTLVNQ